MAGLDPFALLVEELKSDEIQDQVYMALPIEEIKTTYALYQFSWHPQCRCMRIIFSGSYAT